MKIGPAPRRPPAAPPRCRRAGVTLLELVIAGSLLAAVTASLHVVVRGTRVAWDQLDGEAQRLAQVDDGLRFMVRRCREADRLVPSAGGARGQFTLAMPGGHTLRFHRGVTEDIVHVTDSRNAADPIPARELIESVDEFAPTFFEANGVTVTADPAAARSIDISLTVALPRDVNAVRTVRSRVWLRRW